MGLLSSLRKGFFGETAAEKITRIASEHPFQMRFTSEDMTLDDGAIIKVLKFQVRGMFNTGNHFIERDRVTSFVQISSGASAAEMAPVICAIEDYQYKDTPFFHFDLPEIEANYGLVGGWDQWVSLVTVPVAALTFAHRGSQKIQAKFTLGLIAAEKIYEKTTQLSFYNHELGYLDGDEQRKRAMEIAVSLAVLVSGVDGSHDANEARIVKSFISKQLNEVEGAEKLSETKKSLNEAAKKAHAIKNVGLIKRSGMALAREAKEFEPNLKFMIIELLLHIAAADNVAEQDETEFLNMLAHTMGLDVEEYKNMRDDVLKPSMFQSKSAAGSSSKQLEDMLGLKPEMTAAEKNSLLSKEFRKWNHRQNSSDPEKSQQAKEMVREISKLKANLKKSL